MTGVTIITDDDAFSDAFGRALRFLYDAFLVRANSIAEVDDGSNFALVLDADPARDRHGTIEGFYLLRNLLIKPEVRFDAPIAVVCSEKCLFGDERQQIPPAERVKLYSIPFDLSELLSFVTSPDKPKERRYTRMFLRGRLGDDDIKAIAYGDSHRLVHFDIFVQQVEAALFENRRNAFTCPGDDVLQGTYFTNRVLSAEVMLSSLSEVATRTGVFDGMYGMLDQLSSICNSMLELAVFVDGATGNRPVPEHLWPHLVSDLRRKIERPLRVANKEWERTWRNACRAILSPRQEEKHTDQH